ncbi:flippase [Chitinophaga arvensicola]|uniref:Polysaccharide transporter, PST family n=1 Tax=Chitinophaga arvensicola TaxID=29529 RepID=A0A1I0S4Q8_9BACT|nr:flippase [Chitinophaga arvensicola]SEW49663.1 polysaccharide transporter, PST family [Chitinophaga arvensicola]
MHKLFENSGWLLVDKLSKLFPGIIILALIARHLGPEAFGIWNYALALTAIIGNMATLGMERLAVKELIDHEEQQSSIVATIIFMRILAGIACMLISIGFVFITRKNQPLYLYCTVFTSLIIILQSFDVLDYFYQARNSVKKVIIPKVTVFIIFCLVKLMLIYFNAGMPAFLWASVIELVITYLIVLTVYGYQYSSGISSRIDLSLAQSLLLQSWPLILSNLLVVLFMKVDLLLLDLMGSPAELGEYVGAARISELWYAVPTVVAVAILPTLIQKKNSDREAYLLTLEKWLRLSFWLSIAIGVFVTFTASVIIPFLYGPGYVDAPLILMIHIWASAPVFLCIAFVQYLFVEGKYKSYLYGNAAGLLVNVGVNIVLIPRYGGVGAAIATVISYSAVYGTLLLSDKSQQGFLLSKKMFHPGLMLSDVRQVHSSLKIFAGKMLTIHQKTT